MAYIASDKPTRFPSGITFSPDGLANLFGNSNVPDSTFWHVYSEDFNYYNSGDWTVTETQAGATQALADADGGVLLLTNTAADNDLNALQKKGECFLFETGKKLIFKTRFKVSDATQSDFVIGLQITDTTPLDVTDGVFFQKDDGDTNLDFYVEKNNTASTATAITTISDDTYVVVGFYYDGVSAVHYYANGSKLGSLPTTNLPDDEVLTISFGIQNGEAVAKTMSVDYIEVLKERDNPFV